MGNPDMRGAEPWFGKPQGADEAVGCTDGQRAGCPVVSTHRTFCVHGVSVRADLVGSVWAVVTPLRWQKGVNALTDLSLLPSLLSTRKQ